MILYPSIDLRGGRVVRLAQGDYDRETVYGDDPVAVARDFAAAGATWIHVVDLDAARGDGPVNLDAIAAVVDAVDVPVQCGGGVVDDSLLRAGVERVVMGTAAVRQPHSVERMAEAYPGRVAVGVDHRGGDIAVRGWTEASGVGAADLVSRFESAGVAAFVVTDIGRDGMLGGPDVDGLAAVVALTPVAVIASGGVASPDDLRRLAALERDGRRLDGAIVGRAIYEGRLTVAEGVAACALSA